MTDSSSGSPPARDYKPRFPNDGFKGDNTQLRAVWAEAHGFEKALIEGGLEDPQLLEMSNQIVKQLQVCFANYPVEAVALTIPRDQTAESIAWNVAALHLVVLRCRLHENPSPAFVWLLPRAY